APRLTAPQQRLERLVRAGRVQGLVRVRPAAPDHGTYLGKGLSPSPPSRRASPAQSFGEPSLWVAGSRMVPRRKSGLRAFRVATTAEPLLIRVAPIGPIRPGSESAIAA